MTAAIDVGLRRVSREEWDRAFTPPERLSVSEHADRYRFLSPESSAVANLGGGSVPWRTSTLPYLRDIMDDLSAEDVREVVFAKSAQVGGSSVGENWLCWIADHKPAPTLIVYPTEKKFRANVLTRLDPMIRDTPRLARLFPKTGRRTSDDSISIKRFPGGYWQNLTAKSSSDLRSFSARFINCEEIEEWEVDLNEQGDPWGMVRARVIAFGDSYKLFLPCTPKLLASSRIWPLLLASSNGRYHLPCPFCNGTQQLTWQRSTGTESAAVEMAFVWDREPDGSPTPGSVHYRCEHCTRLIGADWRDLMVDEGAWVHQYPNRRTHRGYHIWSAYSRFVSWDTIALEGWKARVSPAQMQTFTNLWLGLPYDPSAVDAVSGHYLRQRAEPMHNKDGELVVPADVGLLTAFTDVQGDRLELFIEGWGAGQRNWKLAWITLEGDPGQLEVWHDLSLALRTPLRHASGHPIYITSMAVDANYQSREVHAFVKDHRPTAFATIGKGGRDRKLLSEPGKPKTKKALDKWRPNWLIGTDAAKDTVDAMLRAPVPGPQGVHFSDQLDGAYFDQLTAEELVLEYQRGRPVRVWRLRKHHFRNEALDAAVGNLAALERLGSAAIKKLGALADELNTTPVVATGAPADPAPSSRAQRGIRSRGLE